MTGARADPAQVFHFHFHFHFYAISPTRIWNSGPRCSDVFSSLRQGKDLMSDDIAGRLSLFILLISLLASHRHLVNDMCVQPRDHVAGYRIG